MKRLTRKALKEKAEYLGAFKLSSNVYKYQNDLSELYYLKPVSLDDSCYDGKELNKLIEKIKNENGSSCRVSVIQEYYSAGIYGNNGQLHKVNVYDSDGVGIINAYYTYYC